MVGCEGIQGKRERDCGLHEVLRSRAVSDAVVGMTSGPVSRRISAFGVRGMASVRDVLSELTSANLRTIRTFPQLLSAALKPKAQHS